MAKEPEIQYRSRVGVGRVPARVCPTASWALCQQEAGVETGHSGAGAGRVADVGTTKRTTTLSIVFVSPSAKLLIKECK